MRVRKFSLILACTWCFRLRKFVFKKCIYKNTHLWDLRTCGKAVRFHHACMQKNYVKPLPPLVIYPLIRYTLGPLDPVTCKEVAPLYWVYRSIRPTMGFDYKKRLELQTKIVKNQILLFPLFTSLCNKRKMICRG